MNESFESPKLDHEKEAEKHEAPATAAKTIYIAIIIGLVLLFLLVGIGLHIPTGG